MSTITAADEALIKARDLVQKAALAVNHAVSEIVIRDCWGSETIGGQERQALIAAQDAILSAHHNLRR